MNSAIQSGYGVRAYPSPAGTRRAQPAGTQSSRFLRLAEQAANGADASAVDAYMQRLKNKYGHVTVQSVGKDQASLRKAGGRMSGSDVVIAPNILQEMASDFQKAAYYEQKIDYFFNTVIPQGNAICAGRGLVFEPCGVVVHEDGSVTYICGCSDSPERVAEVNRINRERDAKRTAQRKQSAERAAAAAVQRGAMWEGLARAKALGQSVSSAGELLRTREASPPPALSELPLPTDASLFFCNF